MHDQITVKFSIEEMDSLVSNLDGLIYSLGFDHDEILIELHSKLIELEDKFKREGKLQ